MQLRSEYELENFGLAFLCLCAGVPIGSVGASAKTPTAAGLTLTHGAATGLTAGATPGMVLTTSGAVSAAAASAASSSAAAAAAAVAGGRSAAGGSATPVDAAATPGGVGVVTGGGLGAAEREGIAAAREVLKEMGCALPVNSIDIDIHYI